ncbi:MAG: hypothetical protein K0S36_2263 [Nitrosospira multiformis]|nr:hypothetical protein [Nitrosospira multiformis]
MLAEAKLNIVPDIESGDVSERRPSEAIAERKSKELVIAFAGPIGSGIQAVKERISDILSASGYQVHQIKISDYLKECISKKLVSVAGEPADSGAERYIQMQDAGNALRNIQADILTEYAIRRVAEIRTEKIGTEAGDVTDFLPERTAYLIDQLKHPEEVALLRAVYGNLFYLFGVLSVTPRRESRLRSEGVEPKKISELIERDRKQPEKNGQQLDKALQLADFFIRNDRSNAEALDSQIKRFIDLIHGANGLSPTKEEYGMYVAYAAGLRSACLSRQVGASIMNVDGTIISTGRNDVPRPGGGLYGPESGTDDARCVKLEASVCHNDVYKRDLLDDIKTVLSAQLGQHLSELSKKEKSCAHTLKGIDVEELSNQIAEVAYEETRLSSLIEFSRSIHAEMDAIVSLALKGTGSTKDGTLFTYTFPCHNCARHIVAAGIKTVYYLEPYEKSLALNLHFDAISLDGIGAAGEAGTTGDHKVRFLHFEGVAPRQYLNMFTPSGERKDKMGKAVRINIREAEKKIPEYLDDYREYELKVVLHLTKVIEGLEAGGLSS